MQALCLAYSIRQITLFLNLLKYYVILSLYVFMLYVIDEYSPFWFVTQSIITGM